MFADCGPGDHDPVTGVRTEVHAMDLISAAWILEKAQREQWPTASDGPANHHLCETRNRWFESSESGALGSETGALAGPHQDAVLPRPVGAASTQPQEVTVADPCGTCGGSKEVPATEMTESGLIRRGTKPCPDC